MGRQQTVVIEVPESGKGEMRVQGLVETGALPSGVDGISNFTAGKSYVPLGGPRQAGGDLKVCALITGTHDFRTGLKYTGWHTRMLPHTALHSTGMFRS